MNLFLFYCPVIALCFGLGLQIPSHIRFFPRWTIFTMYFIFVTISAFPYKTGRHPSYLTKKQILLLVPDCPITAWNPCYFRTGRTCCVKNVKGDLLEYVFYKCAILCLSGTCLIMAGIFRSKRVRNDHFICCLLCHHNPRANSRELHYPAQAWRKISPKNCWWTVEGELGIRVQDVQESQSGKGVVLTVSGLMSHRWEGSKSVALKSPW